MTRQFGRDVAALIIDDNDAAETWDLRFRVDPRPSPTDPGAVRYLVRFGDVCTTPQAGQAALLRALRTNSMPDLVLIDHVLSTGGPTPTRAPAGLQIMRWLRLQCEKLEQPIPPCVLWTAEFTPGLAKAFLECGGAFAYGRDVPAAEVVSGLWDVYDDGMRWEPPTPAHRLELGETLPRLLPYLEANLPTHEIANRMLAAGEISPRIKDAHSWVNDSRRQIMTRANSLCAEIGQPPFEGKGLSVALARFASEHGHVWVPLAYRETL